MLLTSETKPRNRLQPKVITVPSLGAEILVRPMTAGRQLAIAEKFPVDEDGKVTDSLRHSAAIVADSVITEAGEPLFSAGELVDGMDAKLFGEISDLVCEFLNPEEFPNVGAKIESGSLSD